MSMKHNYPKAGVDSTLHGIPIKATLVTHPIQILVPSPPSSLQLTRRESYSPYLALISPSNPKKETARIPMDISTYHQIPSCTSTITSHSSGPLFLSIGRQVSTSHIRIDHGSISRTHAALYFLPSPPLQPSIESIETYEENLNPPVNDSVPVSPDSYGLSFYLQELGSKYGCHVNGVRLPSHTSILLYNQDEIQFGNVHEPIFQLRGWVTRSARNNSLSEQEYHHRYNILTSDDHENLQEETKEQQHQQQQQQQQQLEQENNATHVPLHEQVERQEDHSEEDKRQIDPKQEEEEEVLQGREQREAEIQAMIASLDQIPTYSQIRDHWEESENLPTLIHPDSNATREDGNQHDARNHISSLTSIPSSSSSSSTFSTPTNENTFVSLYKLPITSSLLLPSCSTPKNVSSQSPIHYHHITALALDTSGSRLVTGSTDSYLRLYDFAGMDMSNTRPYKSILIEEGNHPIQDLAFSPSAGGDRIFVATTSAQPLLLDREGRTIIQFIKGDPYITDAAKNSGHTASVTSVAWHPQGETSNISCRDIVLSSSADSSVRFWDVVKNKTLFEKLCGRLEDVIRVKNEKGQRISVGGGVLCAVFSPQGRDIAIGTACGSIQIWKWTGGPYTRPARVVYNAHGTHPIVQDPNKVVHPQVKGIHSLVYSPDGTRLASRSMQDNTIRVWEVQKLGQGIEPLHVCVGDLVSHFEASNCAFSPDGKILCAGTSVQNVPGFNNKGRGRQEYGQLKFYRIRTTKDAIKINVPNHSNDIQQNLLHPIVEMNIIEGVSVVKVVWHPKLNQIFLGLADGSVKILYDDRLSSRGALLCVAKGIRVKDELSSLIASKIPQGSSLISGEIITPHSLRDEKLKRKRDLGDDDDTMRTRRPELPATGIKAGDKTSAGVNLSQFLAAGSIKNKNTSGKDPRDELFKYLEGKNYAASALFDGDRKILADKTIEEEQEEQARKK